MSRPLLLVHGWGHDGGVWDRLARLLPGRRILRAEAGYLGAEPAWPGVPEGSLLVGHSAGFASLLQRDLSGCAGLVAINGFTRFLSDDGFPAVADRVLIRMQQGFTANPGDVLHTFRARCGDPAGPGPGFRPDPVAASRLAAGLSVLRQVDQRQAMRSASLPVLALAAADDPIVTPAHTGACFPSDSLRWSDTGGHLLPLSRPDWCAAMIDGFAC